jgi:hypothetical protein
MARRDTLRLGGSARPRRTHRTSMRWPKLDRGLNPAGSISAPRGRGQCASSPARAALAGARKPEQTVPGHLQRARPGADQGVGRYLPLSLGAVFVYQLSLW